VADADAPARPVPTTRILNFFLFAGFTSFSSNLCLSHFSESGPSGIFDQVSFFSLLGNQRE